VTPVARRVARPAEFNNIDKAQGSSENISSLSAVIQRNPQDPEGYNVRGSAMPGRTVPGGAQGFRHRHPAQPEFLPAYSNRALIQRFSGNQKPRSTTKPFDQINGNYDAAYIGRGNLYRKAGRTQDAFNDFQKAIQLDTTDARAYHNRGLIYRAKASTSSPSRISRPPSRWRRTPPNPTTAAAFPIWPRRRRQRLCRLQHGDQARRQNAEAWSNQR